MSLFSEVERNLDRRFKKWTEQIFGANQSDDLVLLRHAILDEIENHVQTLARGARGFPFNQLRVRFMSADPARRELLIAAFGGGRLETDVCDYLVQTGAAVPAGFALEVETVEEGTKPFEIQFEVRNAAASPPIRAAANLEVVSGKANGEQFVLESARVNIGRLAEVSGQRQGIFRRNDIVFTEGADELNATVSRAHAHIRFDANARQFRIYDDASEYGTRIFRDGRTIQVPAGSRGERLIAGDEIYLGRVRLRFQLP
jgi:hypothetical protein